ncbi:MAG: lysoplasmalogenase family protein [Chloroflexota bacterium]|nr:hypothetical protein [Ardenticatenaceae bacterium]
MLFVLVLLAFVIILAAAVIHAQTGERPLPIVWSASIIVLSATILWRFWGIDADRWAQLIARTNPVPETPLQPRRYLNMMVVTMAIGLVATIIIYQNFFIGAGIYLVMQFCLIAAHSGILHLNPRRIAASPALRSTSWRTTLFWLVLTPVVFIVFVYNGSQSLIVAPYVLALGLMAAVVYLGLAYRERPFLFRATAALGATSFVFSDALIGYAVFVNPSTPLVIIISPTYVLAIMLLAQATLAWPELWLRDALEDTENQM